ncbi:RTA1 domain protein, putative [Talaromyces stipitatus ATCC 10500]|uniref:RTA1 domain protein, putative n=1 Tax=Talaromyces stipitatus (strain ATCC 10500 / CBS 375.48 / QM 6759 / NRRL 1006) TaxID=441959 RepID=B8M957_TALSN|nr:RTA1 domain protein, putative [Talaromyces stipitatus ATCC 10500]EED17352.1 RTA1 domain protein, putative [Talaromyces stipitatus ATCC 10500]
MSSNSDSETYSLYPYHPSHVLPIVFAVLIGISLVMHIYQNFRYKFWTVTFWMSWGGTVFTVGWIARCISSYQTSNVNLYIVQTVFIYAGPPIYSASAYNILGRLLHYLPMHAPLHPNRVTIFFVYLGAAVESLTASGAARMATNTDSLSRYKSGGTLVSTALLLQAVIEAMVVSVIALVHYRASRAAHRPPPNVRKLCITLYGTSFLIIFRCICRAVESFTLYASIESCKQGDCSPILTHEWYLYSFEAAPMVLFTYWLNIMHPGRLLPRQKTRYLDLDCKTERLGPGWIDKRSLWQTVIDPFDMSGMISSKPNHESFWLWPEKWPAVVDGSFAQGTASNIQNSRSKPNERSESGHKMLPSQSNP